MELWRAPNASTFVSFPMVSTAGVTLSGLTVTGRWAAWSDTSGPNAQGNPKYRTLTGAITEISASGTYATALAAAELPTASPYVILVYENANAATQYLLVRTSTKLDLSAAADNTVEKALARMYMAATNYLDAQLSAIPTLGTALNLTSPADNSVGKALSRVYMLATNYVDAAITSRSAPATAQTIDQTTAISGGTDNSIGKMFSRLYHATAYLNASITSRIALTDTITLGSPVDNTVDKALARLYMLATNYVDASVSSRLSSTATFAEPAQGAPGATLSVPDKIGYLFKAWRNKTEQTATRYALYNDDTTTLDHKATVSDDGTVFTKNEIATGP